MELKKRNEMNGEFMWDLTPIYKNRQEWQAAYKTAQSFVEKVPQLAGTFKNSPQGLKYGLDFIAKTAQAVELVSLYAFLQKSGDNGDSEYQELQAKAISLSVALNTNSAFMSPEILAIPQEDLDRWLQDSEMHTYRHMVEDIARGRQHTLNGEGEKLIAMLGEVANIPSDSFEMLESVDMTFPTITDDKGETVTLTHGNFGVYRESKSVTVRKESFEKYFGEFKKYINTFAALYSGAVKLDSFFADIRGYESACHAALFKTNVPISVYDSLTQSVHEGLPTMARYLQLRKKVLGLEELHMYDLYTPMLPSVEYPMPYEKAKQLVKAACKPLGENYAQLLEEAFSGGWIDVYENKGKTTGAYSCGVYGVHPYVLLNYSDKLDDAFTLAHELGHAMHSYLSAKKQDYINSDYEITVAEVASTVNEVLLTMYMLKTEEDKDRRAYVLNHFLEGFRTTVFRQTLFAEFERKAHDLYKEGTPLTAATLNKLYRELNETYYEGAVVDPLQDIEWARIPHFYNSFYVYQYATGFSSAVAIAKSIIDSGDPSSYLEFLSTGGSDYPINELKIAGVDLTSPQTVKTALAVFEGALAELEEILSR
ncbi:MAG: oligoendopeptidase F [Oscillospiraceae bacterium]